MRDSDIPEQGSDEESVELIEVHPTSDFIKKMKSISPKYFSNSSSFELWVYGLLCGVRETRNTSNLAIFTSITIKHAHAIMQ